MRDASKIKFIITLFFWISICANTTIGATVPLVSTWYYSSPNDIDYRSFHGDVMTVNVTNPETLVSTWPRAKYPAGQDFTAAVDFSNFFTGENVATPLELYHPSTYIGIQWRIADVNGSPAYSQIFINRSSYNDGNDGFDAVYGSFGTNYNETYQQFHGTGNDLNGTFVISKMGNSVTVSVKNTNGTVLHTWSFISITTFDADISVFLTTTNGSKAATSVQFSNLNMDPVPVDINWFSIQRRYKEVVGEFNRCTFSAIDTSGNYVASDIFSSVQVLDPSGNIIALGSKSFSGLYDNLSGRYDATNGKWIYNSFSPESYFNWNFIGDLPVGQYHLVATTNSGITYHRYLDYSGIATLPVISSTSFYAYKDEDRNLLFSWKVPYNSSFISSGLNTQVRAWVDVYEGEVLKAEVYVSVPTHMGHVFIPENIVQLYESKGSSYQIGVQLRTTDNGTRSYSSNVPLALAQGPPIPGDVDGNGKVGLEEAINALKTVSGEQ